MQMQMLVLIKQNLSQCSKCYAMLCWYNLFQSDAHRLVNSGFSSPLRAVLYLSIAFSWMPASKVYASSLLWCRLGFFWRCRGWVLYSVDTVVVQETCSEYFGGEWVDGWRSRESSVWCGCCIRIRSIRIIRWAPLCLMPVMVVHFETCSVVLVTIWWYMIKLVEHCSGWWWYSVVKQMLRNAVAMQWKQTLMLMLMRKSKTLCWNAEMLKYAENAAARYAGWGKMLKNIGKWRMSSLVRSESCPDLVVTNVLSSRGNSEGGRWMI